MEIMKMFVVCAKSVRAYKLVAFGLVVSLALASPFAYARKKKKKAAEPAPAAQKIDMSKVIDLSTLVWPGPPDTARIRYVNYFAGEKIDRTPAAKQKKKKEGWMDRLAGTPVGEEKQEKMLKDFPYQLIGPYGVGVDSKGLVYVADQRCGAIFIFNPETRDVQLIENGRDAKFGWINGIALDDNDRLFVSDGKLGHVLVFNPQHKLEGVIRDGMVDPNGLAIDTENRLLYVVDTQQDQVLVYDADTYKLLRRIGKQSEKKHSLTSPGNFAAPTNVAVDSDGNVYVTDTLNDRVEIFDGGGNFISTFGHNCDQPGCFERPKGIAVDKDGDIWVVDSLMDKLQILNRKGQVLMAIGNHGTLPSQFSDVVGIGYDKVRNRVYTTEQYPGRMQEFQYITAEQVQADKDRAAEQRKQKYGGAETQPAAKPAPATTAPATPAPATPAPAAAAK
jgi:DNA-binding beta-propeller fold protein YncE